LKICTIYILVTAIIARNTPGKLQSVDIHGLRVQEAIEVVEKAFREALISGYGTLKVVTGRGLHSKNNLPVLKNAVIREMEK
jgi:DNA-nicking Smr family endonuclease